MLGSAKAFSGYSVNDLEEAKTFYGEMLGIELDDTGMGLTMRFPNGHSVFLYEKEDHIPATFTVLNFPVDDINVAVDSLVEAPKHLFGQLEPVLAGGCETDDSSTITLDQLGAQFLLELAQLLRN